MGTGSEEALIDRVVDAILRGERPNVEEIIAGAPELSDSTRAELRRIEVAFAGARAPSTTTSAALPFERLGPYRLIERLGEGGMGTVFLAEHEFLARRVALKIVRPELVLSDARRRRFHREAMSIARLRHAHIVTVYDAGEHDGVAYLAMERVEGRGLDELLDAERRADRRMDVAVAVGLARDVARALQCAHEAGVVHRDVKPGNVRVTPDGRAMLLDFGLSAVEDLAPITATGQFHGTPQYASPEQIDPRGAELDARTDVYSLGATLYECLTGRPPHESATLLQLFRRVLDDAPDAPSRSNPSADAELDAIVARAMAKDRERRYESAAAFADALAGWLHDAAARSGARTRSRVRVAAIACGVVLAALATIAFLRPGHARDEDGARAANGSSEKHAQPVALSASRVSTALLGGPELAFDRRLADWDPPIGSGTFGADEDGAGVVGNDASGITVVPHPIAHVEGRVHGRVGLIGVLGADARSESRTRGAGFGVELSDHRVLALLCGGVGDVPGAELVELERDGAGWRRRDVIAKRVLASSIDGPLALAIGWNATDVELEAPGTETAPWLVPRERLAGAHPRRFVLVVEEGGARFEELLLEETP